MVKIRLKRLGRKKLPFYRIIAIDSRKRQNGPALAQLGWYDPIKKQSYPTHEVKSKPIPNYYSSQMLVYLV